jgi:hypothetical protein
MQQSQLLIKTLFLIKIVYRTVLYNYKSSKYYSEVIRDNFHQKFIFMKLKLT